VDGHEIATGNGIPKKPGWSIFFVTHVALAPSAGSVVVKALPLKSTAMHKSVSADTHDTARSWVVPSMFSESHDVPPVVEVNALPLPSTATQNTADVQDTPLNAVVPSTLDVSQCADVPAPASPEPRMLPFESTATQNVEVTQDTPFRELAALTVS